MNISKKIIYGIVLVTGLGSIKAQKTAAPQLKTQIDTVSYAIGLSIGNNLKATQVSEINADVLAKAINNVLKNENTVFTPEQANDFVRNYFEGLQKAKQEANVKAGEKFLAENKTKKGVVTLPSGLQYQIITEGKGPKPKVTDKVKTHYHGTLLDGTVFDSSVDRKEPVSFPVTQVIPGWTEALQLMPVGSKWKLFIPSNLAYGEQGAGGAIGPGATLIFEVELLAIEAD